MRIAEPYLQGRWSIADTLAKLFQAPTQPFFHPPGCSSFLEGMNHVGSLAFILRSFAAHHDVKGGRGGAMGPKIGYSVLKIGEGEPLAGILVNRLERDAIPAGGATERGAAGPATSDPEGNPGGLEGIGLEGNLV